MQHIHQLINAIGKEKVLIEDFERYVYATDWSVRTKEEIIMPDVVVCPKTTEDISKVLKIAYKNRIPVVVGGGLTGMSGGAVSLYKGIYIDSTSMNKILEIDIENQTIRAQSGATIQEVNDAVEKYNLWLPHQPESKWVCTLGASISCDNDSTFGMKFGKILNCLLSLQVVDGKGEVYEFGHRKAHFTSSGYKIKDLFVGSEGTLGIITECTLKLQPKPKERSIDMIVFPSMKTSVDYLNHLLKSGLCIESVNINCKKRLKFYTHSYTKKYGKNAEIPAWAESLLAITFSGEKDVVEFNRNYALKIAKNFNGELLKEREIVNAWWASKYTLEFEPFKQKWADSQREKKFGAVDPGVPLGRLEEIYKKFIEIAKKYDLEVLGMNAYLESANSIGFSLSCAVYVDYRNQDEVNRYRKYFEEISKIAVDLQGTSSTYMGDTNLRVPYFEYEHKKSAKYMLKIKKIFDPRGILNPGKKFEAFFQNL